MLTEKQAAELVCLSRSTVRRLIQRKQFPIPIQIAPRRIVFFEDEIALWQDARAKDRS
jgi:predicted DNA-binding transcriptional regulator AlpA